MAFDAHKNFAYSTVLTAPSPATSGTSLGVQSSDGAGFPAVSFNAVVWPAGQLPTRANAEIVRVTGNAADVFTITRAQESTNARSIVVGDQIAAVITLKTLTDIEAGTNFTTLSASGAVSAGSTVTAGTVSSGSTLRATGASTAAAGAGIELLFVTSIGIIQAYDRTAAAFRTMHFSGATIELQVAGVVKLTVGASGGITIGAPTGGDKGTGTINCAADIYKNNTAYTNPKWALKWTFNHGVVDAEGPYAAPSWYRGLRPLEEHRAFVAKHFDLPLMVEEPDAGLFGRGDLLLASLEEAYLYIYQLHDRLTRLEHDGARARPGGGMRPGRSS